MQSIVCLGGASIDRTYYADSVVRKGTSNPARVRRGFGGVARNVAENAARLGLSATLFSAVGADADGDALVRQAQSAGIDTTLVARDAQCGTPEFAAILEPNGELFAGAADASAIERIGPADLERHLAFIERCAWFFVDCNVRADVLAACISFARERPVKLAIDAVSEAKVKRIPQDLHGVSVVFMNEGEAAAYLSERPEAAAAALRRRGAESAVITMGARGAAVASAGASAIVPAVKAEIVNANGAGDSLCAVTLYRLLQGDAPADAVRIGLLAAALTLESDGSVRPDMTPELLSAHRLRLGSA